MSHDCYCYHLDTAWTLKHEVTGSNPQLWHLCPWARYIVYPNCLVPRGGPKYRPLRARRALLPVETCSVENQKGAIAVQSIWQ